MARRKSGSAPKRVKKRTPRLALYLPRQVQDLYPYVLAVWLKIKGDTVHFPSTTPPAAQVDGNLAKLHDALKDAEGGGTVAVSALQLAEQNVRQDFDMLAGYVRGVLRTLSAEDATALIAAILLHVSKVGQHGPKAPLAVKDGPGSGTAILRALAVAHAMHYEWEMSSDQTNWSMFAETAQSHTTVQGLTPGKTYYFRFRCLLRDNTKTDPSHAVPHLVR